MSSCSNCSQSRRGDSRLFLLLHKDGAAPSPVAFHFYSVLRSALLLDIVSPFILAPIFTIIIIITACRSSLNTWPTFSFSAQTVSCSLSATVGIFRVLFYISDAAAVAHLLLSCRSRGFLIPTSRRPRPRRRQIRIVDVLVIVGT